MCRAVRFHRLVFDPRVKFDLLFRLIHDHHGNLAVRIEKCHCQQIIVIGRTDDALRAGTEEFRKMSEIVKRVTEIHACFSSL